MNSAILTLLTVSLLASLALNIWLYRQSKKKLKERPQSLELREFLGDLLSGAAIVAVGRVNPDDILLRSPKNK